MVKLNANASSLYFSTMHGTSLQKAMTSTAASQAGPHGLCRKRQILLLSSPGTFTTFLSYLKEMPQ